MKKILSAFFAAFLLASLCALPAFAVSQARSVNATTTAETMSLVCEYCGQSDMICVDEYYACLLYTSPSPRDRTRSRMPSSA